MSRSERFTSIVVAARGERVAARYLLVFSIVTLTLSLGCLKTQTADAPNDTEKQSPASSQAQEGQQGPSLIYLGDSDISFIERDQHCITRVVAARDLQGLVETRALWPGGVVVLDNTSPEDLSPILPDLYRSIRVNGTSLIVLGGRSAMGSGVTSSQWGDVDPQQSWTLPIVIRGHPPMEKFGSLSATMETKLLEGVDLQRIPVREIYPAEPAPGSIIVLLTTSHPSHPVLVWWDLGKKRAKVITWCADSTSLLTSEDGRKLLANMVEFCRK